MCKAESKESDLGFSPGFCFAVWSGEIQFTEHTIQQFKVHNLVVFSIITDISTVTTVLNFRSFSSSQKEILQC